MTRYLEIKPGSISETIKRLSDDYQAVFKAELEKAGKGLAQMTDAEKKAFFNKIDKMHNAKSEEAPAKKLDDTNSTMVVKPGAPAGQEKVIRVPKEKLADYKSKGYVEAESYIPEATAKEGVTGAVAGGVLGGMAAGPIGAVAGAYLGHKVQKAAAKKKEEKEIEELTAGQKKLPPALQKAIKAKEKKEEVEITETEGSGGGMDALRAIKAKRQRLQGELEALNKDDSNYKEKRAAKQKEIEAQKEIMARKQREVFDSYDPNLDDLLDLYEGGFKDIDIRKGDLKLTKDKRDNLKDKYNAIMANNMQGDENAIADQIQKLEISIKKQEQELIDIMKKGKDSEKKEAVEGIEEAVGPDRITNLNDKISRLQLSIAKLDKSKPESKTKEAILKSDLNTAKLRLTDIMKQNAAKAVNEAIKAKQSYKSLKMSLKKEQDMDNKKKTLTDKPITKIEVNPKIEG